MGDWVIERFIFPPGITQGPGWRIHAIVWSPRRLKAWLRAGETVTLRDRKQVIARIVPERPASVEWPDFQTLRKEIFGDRLLPGADLLLKERGRF